LRQSFTPAKRRRAAEEWATNGKSTPEVAAAFAGQTEATARTDSADETIVSVAAPIQRPGGPIRGALLLSTQGGDIDSVIASERWALLRVFLVLATVMLVLSLLLANTIAEPVRKLAEAAERVRRGIRSRQQIPDFTARSDEIGHLSGALRDMTQALYNRIDAIESFAADVAHELKNPLTSLRSAVETLPRVKSGPSRDRLLDIMQHDVHRLDRLISDISNASRLDAELARGDSSPVDLVEVVKAVVAMVSDSPRSNGVTLKLTVERRGGARPTDFIVLGHDSRLAQVLTNLIDNACSFSKPGNEVRVTLRHPARQPTADGGEGLEEVWAIVDDDGPGIPPHALERIFERFYTDRPEQGFGQNSGLGLSISRQIVEAHGGRIWAENRPGTAETVDGEEPTRHGAGARFVVVLPAIAT
jgi:two-component system sensor histidine kinase ChvG